ncbi:hypothetical protein DFQ26_008807 [Actinomortierella ambigua]|nr:hypothetical protein DFQ26_008807 [Actinomortierella ambigua]
MRKFRPWLAIAATMLGYKLTWTINLSVTTTCCQSSAPPPPPPHPTDTASYPPHAAPPSSYTLKSAVFDSRSESLHGEPHPYEAGGAGLEEDQHGREARPLSSERARLHLADEMVDLLEDLLDSPGLEPCQMCRQGLQLAQVFAQKAPDMVPGTLRVLCRKYSFLRLDACDGLLARLGPQLVEIFSDLKVNSTDGYYFCSYTFPGSCPTPQHQSSSTTLSTLFPKPKPQNAVQPPPSGKRFKVLHFSDWHLDPLYRPGTEAKCKHNICCRDYGKWGEPGPIQKKASKWGEPKCDTPIALGLSALQAIPRMLGMDSGNVEGQQDKEGGVRFGIFTGDIASHDSWMITQKYIIEEEARSYGLFYRYLKGLKLYVTMGNHDSYPADQAPSKLRASQYVTHKWLYDSVASIWKSNGWITSIEEEYAKSHNAMLMTRPVPGLKLISLNTDHYYVRNLFTMLDTNLDDPSGMMQDLVLELQDSEDRGERVWIIGHMAPVFRSLPKSSFLFQRIIARYSPHVIAGLFFGHFHQDKFFLVHDPDAPVKDASSAVQVAFQAPSVTPLDYSNPAFRWYEVDAETFSVLDVHTAFANISEADEWEAQGVDPDWKLEYSARAVYDDPAQPLGTNDPLSPQFWYHAAERMKVDPQLFDRYIQYQAKSSIWADPCPAVEKEREMENGDDDHNNNIGLGNLNNHPALSACAASTICQLQQASNVVETEQCLTLFETMMSAKGHKKKKKGHKNRFGTTRTGRVNRVEDYDAERGISGP